MTTFAGGPEPSDDDSDNPQEDASPLARSIEDLPAPLRDVGEVRRLDAKGRHLVLYRLIELSDGVRLLSVSVLRLPGDDSRLDERDATNGVAPPSQGTAPAIEYFCEEPAPPAGS